MPRRLTPPTDPVQLRHDGSPVVAQRGESIAHALIAAGRLPLARSPKLHRPRGPYCLRGGCDGCLARVDGVPDVMTCQRTVRGGETVETQNVLGTRSVDALRAADFLFPRGFDHHRLFAGILGVSNVVQSFARRVAGLGRLPDAEAPARPAERRELDVLVVGGGEAGLTAAAALSGVSTLLVDDAPSLGGSLRALSPARIAGVVERARAAGAELWAETTAIGLFREPAAPQPRLHAVLLGPERATLVTARCVLLATGTHDPVLAFGDNDLPGVVSARAALLLLAGGIAVGDRVVLAGSGRFADAFERAARGTLAVMRVDATQLVAATGSSTVTGVVLRRGDDTAREAADAVVIDGAASPALELAVQGDARVLTAPDGTFRLDRGPGGELAPAVFGAGSLCESDAALDGARVAVQIRRALGAR